MEEEICSEEVSCFTGSLAPFKDDLVFPEEVNFAALTELLDRNEVIMDTVNTIKLWVSLSSHPFLPYKLSKAFRPIQKVNMINVLRPDIEACFHTSPFILKIIIEILVLSLRSSN